MGAVSDELQHMFAYYSIEAENCPVLMPAQNGRLVRQSVTHPKVSLLYYNFQFQRFVSQEPDSKYSMPLLNGEFNGRKMKPDAVIQFEGKLETVDMFGSRSSGIQNVLVGGYEWGSVYVEFSSLLSSRHLFRTFIDKLDSDGHVSSTAPFYDRIFAIIIPERNLSDVVEAAFQVMRERTAPIL